MTDSITRLRAAELARQQGAWTADIDDPGTPIERWNGRFYVEPDGDTWSALDDDGPHDVANARWIEACSTGVPALLARVAELEMLAQAERVYRVAIDDLAALGDALSDRPSAEALAPHRIRARKRVDEARAVLIAAGGEP